MKNQLIAVATRAELSQHKNLTVVVRVHYKVRSSYLTHTIRLYRNI
jgi:hypothetical protein